MKNWTKIFKALGNINRLQIISLLSGGKRMNVSELAAELGISLKSTSKHLLILFNLDVLESRGKNNRVEYWLSPDMPADFKRTIKLFL